MTGRLWHVPVYFTILKLSDIMSVNSFLSVMILSKLTHYVDLGIFCQNRTKNHFSEIISNQSCSPTLDRKEHRGWTISYENSLLKVYFIRYLDPWPSTLIQDRPIQLKRPFTIVEDHPLWLKWPSTLTQDCPVLDGPSTFAGSSAFAGTSNLRTVYFGLLGPPTLDSLHFWIRTEFAGPLNFKKYNFRNKRKRIFETSFSSRENNFCWSDGRV